MVVLQEATIPDVVSENLNQSKLTLANNVIKNVYPLFDEVQREKRHEVKELEKQLQEAKNQVQQRKRILEKLLNDYNRQKKVRKLLNRIERLVNSGLIYDGTLRNDTRILLKVIPKLTDEKLDFHLQDVLKTINKRFSKPTL